MDRTLARINGFGTGFTAEVFGALGVWTFARLAQLSLSGYELPRNVAVGGAGMFPEVAVVATGTALLLGAACCGMYYLFSRQQRINIEAEVSSG